MELEVPGDLADLLSGYTSRAWELAAEYCERAGRSSVASKDLEIALKYICRYDFFPRSPDNSDESSESEEGEDDLSDTGDSDVEWTPVPNDENDIDEFIEKIHLCHDEWEEWDPPTPMQSFMKKSIDNTFK